MNKNKLNSILEDHYKWLLSDYKDGSRADLRGANLYNANLQYSNLSDTNLSYTKLK